MGNSTCSVLVPSNTLFGTASADQVRISKADGADGLAGKYKVVINGQSRVMDQAELENTLSRIYIGVHWRFDGTYGQAAGEQIGAWVFNNFLKPR